MKLGSLISNRSLDGELVVISRDLKLMVKATDISPCLREALEHWSSVEEDLQKISDDLNNGRLAKDAMPYDDARLHSALPRTWLFADGSAFIQHIKLVRQARKAELPATLETVPLMYQGESGKFLNPRENIPQIDEAHGTDFEAEVGVITDFVPMGISPQKALEKIRLIVLINDVSLRGLIPAELASGFGFFQSKPTSALSPVAVTPDELGQAWEKGKLKLPLHVKFNGESFGTANAGAMFFHFGDLIAHAAKTRDLAAGSLIGSGTVSNEDEATGCSCIVEKRTLETIKTGNAVTPFMKDGDRVEIFMLDENGQRIFGTISQSVKKVRV
ncbi:MAG: fumarylacetoacetate hydrolase family protein [Bdellovibrionota bacterium]